METETTIDLATAQLEYTRAEQIWRLENELHRRESDHVAARTRTLRDQAYGLADQLYHAQLTLAVEDYRAAQKEARKRWIEIDSVRWHTEVEKLTKAFRALKADFEVERLSTREKANTDIAMLFGFELREFADRVTAARDAYVAAGDVLRAAKAEYDQLGYNLNNQKALEAFWTAAGQRDAQKYRDLHFVALETFAVQTAPEGELERHYVPLHGLMRNKARAWYVLAYNVVSGEKAAIHG